VYLTLTPSAMLQASVMWSLWAIHSILESVIVHTCDLGLAHYGIVYAKGWKAGNHVSNNGLHNGVCWNVTYACCSYCNYNRQILIWAAVLTREWSGWSGQNLTSLMELTDICPFSNDCTQNFSYWYGVKKLLKFAMHSSDLCDHAYVWWQHT
jgi:hypothetical protein